MLQTAAADQPDRKDAETSARALLDVITELAAVMEEENRLLAEGFPAGLSGTSERKDELSEEYADLWQRLHADASEVVAADPEFCRGLMRAVFDLRLIASENVARLDTAMAASRRRVEAAMAALREDAPAEEGGVLDRFPVSGTPFHQA